MADGNGLQNNTSLGLAPQPESKIETPKSCVHKMESELRMNRERLALTKQVMRNIKEEIDKLSDILRRETGDVVEIVTLVRSVDGIGFLNRSQEIMNLRLKLSAMKSQFLEPVHKPYYRGPFDPRKRFDIKLLPQKRENLYCQDEKKMFQNPLRDLNLMHRASLYRNKSLKKKVASASQRLQVFKAQTQDNAKTIEYMVSHQNLMKLMLNPETLELDESLPRVRSELRIEKEELATDVQKYKTLYERSKKECQLVQEKISSLAEIMDKNAADLIAAEELRAKNRCDFEVLRLPPELKGKDKKKTTDVESQKEFDMIVEENNRLREFLLSPVFSNVEDLQLFLASLKNARSDFLLSSEEIRRDFSQTQYSSLENNN